MEGEYGEKKIVGKTVYLKEMDIDKGVIRCFALFCYEQSQTPIAFILTMEHGDPVTHCDIWHIYTDRRWRRKGCASALIDKLKSKYQKIQSQISTHEGRYLLLKSGFKNTKHKPSDLEMWVWTKGGSYEEERPEGERDSSAQSGSGEAQGD